VLIYERIREELAAGRSLRDAIRHGFHAVFIVILDSHLTVLLAAFVLLQFGAGSVQGFAADDGLRPDRQPLHELDGKPTRCARSGSSGPAS